MKKHNAKELLLKHRLGNLNEEEKAILEAWYIAYSLNMPPADLSEQQLAEDLSYVSALLPLKESTVKPLPKNRFLYKLSAAAAVLILVSFGISFYIRQTTIKPEISTKVSQEILPADQKAVLTLANNTKIVLDDLSIGELAKQAGISISKTADGKIKYKVLPTESSATEVQFNKIMTPRGAHYQVELADGTIAWLNAASSIKFPTRFAGKNRSVVITGEVYFEVAKHKDKIFQVNTGSQLIEVLGTHFNVDAHRKNAIVTTLIEGSIRVSADKDGISRNLVPGEQSIYNMNESTLNVDRVNTEKSVSWKNGYFLFDDEDITSIMDEISLWYDVEVSYSRLKKTGKKFSGDISRSKTLAQVLKVIEVSGNVKFELDGRRVKVIM